MYGEFGSTIVFHLSKLWKAKFFILSAWCNITDEAAGEILTRSLSGGKERILRRRKCLQCFLFYIGKQLDMNTFWGFLKCIFSVNTTGYLWGWYDSVVTSNQNSQDLIYFARVMIGSFKSICVDPCHVTEGWPAKIGSRWLAYYSTCLFCNMVCSRGRNRSIITT